MENHFLIMWTSLSTTKIRWREKVICLFVLKSVTPWSFNWPNPFSVSTKRTISSFFQSNGQCGRSPVEDQRYSLREVYWSAAQVETNTWPWKMGSCTARWFPERSRQLFGPRSLAWKTILVGLDRPSGFNCLKAD